MPRGTETKIKQKAQTENGKLQYATDNHKMSLSLKLRFLKGEI